MSFYEQWVEIDLNPIISFCSSGKILYSNSEAQFVLNRVNKKELFELAVKNASTTFGVKTTYVDLKLKNYVFYAITVQYENEDELHLKLYKSTTTKKETSIKQEDANLANIFTLVDLCISSAKIKSSCIFIKNYDPSIPEFNIVASDLIKLLSSIYTSFINTQKINTLVKLKIGEYLKVEGKKHSLVSIEVSCDEDINNINFKDIKEENYNSLIVKKEDQKIIIDLPLIMN